MHYFFTVLRNPACICFGPICRPSSVGRVYNVANGICCTAKSTVGGPAKSRLKANSHMPCRARAVPLSCCVALVHTWHAVPLPFPDSAVSFVKVRMVAGNIRTASSTV
jgi:hypothetical protein